MAAADGGLVLANRALEDALGLRPGSGPGHSFVASLGGEAAHRVPEIQRRVLESSIVVETELVLGDAEGRRTWTA